MSWYKSALKQMPLLSVFMCGPLVADVDNPIIFADFSDPDVVQVDGVYTMLASSFNHQPGVPVLTSTDMVNWERVGYVMQNHPEQEYFQVPRHGEGMWAPCLRYHDGLYWAFMPDPDFGIYVSTAESPAGPWSEPHLLLSGKGIIDPTPLWDDDGNAYLLHGWAKSRAGINNLLTLHKMSADGREVLDEGEIIIDANQIPGFRTLEGPKFYKKDGYYYVFAPAGGVAEGWQTVFRSKDIRGPYEYQITLEQGMTDVNGPHQGAWVVDPTGKDWFFHFQELEPFGRIVHLQTMSWENGWPVMGQDLDGNGTGEPLATLPIDADQKPIGGLSASDDFSGSKLGLQWQWSANWQNDWYSLTDQQGYLRLFAQPKPTLNLWQQPALLTQMLYGPTMDVRTQITLDDSGADIESGLLLYGYDYAWIGLRREDGKTQLVFETCMDTLQDCTPESEVIAEISSAEVQVSLATDDKGAATFQWRESDEADWQGVDHAFDAQPGRWVGSRVGLFAQADSAENSGFVDVDYFTVDVK